MNIREIGLPQINLMDSGRGNDWWVDLESFFEFSFWIAEELEDLVSKSVLTVD